MVSTEAKSPRARNLLFFAGCALAWLLLDLLTKEVCEGAGLGAILVPDFLGLVQIRVVHNFGAAWSMFEGNVVPLAILAIIVCSLLLAYVVHEAKRASLVEMLACALVFAGGIGNLVDRLVRGYVVDMISPLFIDFPTFNVADIGVTCGIAALLVILVMQLSDQQETPKED